MAPAFRGTELRAQGRTMIRLTPRRAAFGIALIALAIGRADLEIAIEADQERAEVTMVRVGGRINHGLLDAVKSVNECARLAKLPPPGPCRALPCGWVLNPTCWSSCGNP